MKPTDGAVFQRDRSLGDSTPPSDKNDSILVKTYYAVDELDQAHGIDHRRARMEWLLKRLRESASSTGERTYCLCELLPARTYDFVALARRVQYPPITAITDAEPKCLVLGSDGPIECVATIRARRTDHDCGQYIELHEQWQADFSKYIPLSRWMIEPEEADAFVDRSLRYGAGGESPCPGEDGGTAGQVPDDSVANGEAHHAPSAPEPPPPPIGTPAFYATLRECRLGSPRTGKARATSHNAEAAPLQFGHAVNCLAAESARRAPRRR